MALTTPILDRDVASRLRDIYKSKEQELVKLRNVRSVFLQYLLAEDALFFKVPETASQYESQRQLVIDMSRAFGDSDESDHLSEDYKDGLVKTEVIAVIDGFDDSKGFGFADIGEYDGRVFIHANTLKENGFEYVSDGDKLRCDISRGSKGLFISKIHEIQTDEDSTIRADCTITRVFPDRAYGFAAVNGESRDAFFYFNRFVGIDGSKVVEGLNFHALLQPDVQEKNMLVKRVEKIG